MFQQTWTTQMNWFFKFQDEIIDQFQFKKHYEQSYRLHPLRGFACNSSTVNPHSPMLANPQVIINKMDIINTLMGSNTTVSTAVWKENGCDI